MPNQSCFLHCCDCCMARIHTLTFYCVIFDKLLAFVVKSGRFSSITKINLFFTKVVAQCFAMLKRQHHFAVISFAVIKLASSELRWLQLNPK